MRGVARTAVVAGTATAVSNRVSRRQANRWAGQEQQQAYQQAPPAYAPPPPAYQEPAPAPAPQEAPPDMNAKLAQLDQLGELKAKGVLTDVEFEIQKQRILNS
jgi:hypothetical protein